MENDNGVKNMLLALSVIGITTGCCGLALLKSEGYVQQGVVDGHVGKISDGASVGIYVDTNSEPIVRAHLAFGGNLVSCESSVNRSNSRHNICDIDISPVLTLTPTPSGE